MKKTRNTLLGAVLMAACLTVGQATAVTFTPLGDLPGGIFESIANGVSADGSVVVGESDSTSGFEAFRWTSGSGMVGLGDLPGGPFQSEAIDVSADGSVVVGVGNSASGYEAFHWTSGGGMVGLGDLPGGSFESGAYGVSADGSVVVGYGKYATTATGFEAFRWTAGGGMVGLGDLPGEPFSSGAFGISDDGTVVVGSGNAVQPETGPLTASEAFRWTADGGMVGLGDLPGGIFLSVPEGVSADGSVVVGVGNGDIGTAGAEAFRWTTGGGMAGLGDLPGGIFSSYAIDVSADGSVVVGFGSTASGREAFYWTAGGGMRNLRELLIAGGATGLTGWTLRQAKGVSADGRTIVGFGINPRGQTEAWIAQLDLGPTLAGDFNADGTVDAADYVVWRKGLGTTYTQNDYDTWRANFGNRPPIVDGSVATGVGASPEPLPVVVPEPSGLLLLIAGAGLAGFRRHGRWISAVSCRYEFFCGVSRNSTLRCSASAIRSSIASDCPS